MQMRGDLQPRNEEKEQIGICIMMRQQANEVNEEEILASFFTCSSFNYHKSGDQKLELEINQTLQGGS